MWSLRPGESVPSRALLALGILGLLLFAGAAEAQRSETLRWIAPTDQPVDGYVAYLGFASRSYPDVIDLGFLPADASGVVSVTIDNLQTGADYFAAVTAYNAAGESAYSNEIVLSGAACSASQCDDGDPCSVDQCDVLGCSYTPAADGTACDDGLAGTIGDICTGGFCQGVVPQCFVDADCSNGDVCDGAESCLGNACVAGTTLSCSAAGECTSPFCDPGSGCRVDPLPDGVACAGGSGACVAGICQAFACFVDADCSDGDVCNGSERCQGNVCVSGTPLACLAPSQCVVGTCVAGVGCGAVPRPNGSACDDGLSGTIADVCTGGVCQGVVPQCTVDADCGDGDVCNGSERCQGNVCVAGAALSCPAPTECTTSSCNATSGCQVTPRPDGVSCASGGGVCAAGSCQLFECQVDADCADGNVCNGSETCQSNRCVAGASLSCSAGGECTTGVCDAGSGCQVAPVQDGVFCSGGSGVCMAGGCQLIDCTPGTRRQQERCWAAKGSSSGCQASADCDDGDLCNGLEQCIGGICIAGTSLACAAPSQCEVGVCLAGLGCGATPKADGSICNDGQPGTIGDVCSGGVCQGVVPQCTVAADCSDGDVCNGTERCQSNVCVAGSALSCAAPTDCTTSRCDASSGCQVDPVPDGVACASGGGVCSGGACLAFQCQADSDCDDGSVCNGSESCQGNVCVAGASLSCPAPTECSTSVCDAVSGCQVAALSDGVACSGGLCVSGSCQPVACVTDSQCDDLDPCSGQERCVANSCVAGARLSCLSPSQCQVGVCIAGQGCAQAPVADGSSCDDGFSTTVADACFGGVCQGALIPASLGQCVGAPNGALCSSGSGVGVCMTGSCLVIDCSVGTRRQQQRCWQAFYELGLTP